jgi:hypothetical protein
VTDSFFDFHVFQPDLVCHCCASAGHSCTFMWWDALCADCREEGHKPCMFRSWDWWFYNYPKGGAEVFSYNNCTLQDIFQCRPLAFLYLRASFCRTVALSSLLRALAALMMGHPWVLSSITRTISSRSQMATYCDTCQLVSDFRAAHSWHSTPPGTFNYCLSFLPPTMHLLPRRLSAPPVSVLVRHRVNNPTRLPFCHL